MFPFAPRRDLFPPRNQPIPQQGQFPSPVGNIDFNPQQAPSITQPQVQNDGPDANLNAFHSRMAPDNPSMDSGDEYSQRMRAIFESANGPATKAYSDYLKTYPDQKKGGKMNTLAAALSGAGAGWRNPREGALIAQEIKNQPRVKTLGEWNSKGGALKAGADLEDKSFRDKMGVMKEVDTVNRNNAKDKDEASLHDAQRNNYTSLIKERDKGKITYHEDKTSGRLFSINENGEKKDLGVMDLTPQQKEDLKVTTFNKEEGTRQGGRKSLFDYTNDKIKNRNIDTHKANREFDVNNPLPSRSTTSTGYESIDQQNKAITASAKELNIENGGKYSHLFNADGTLIDPKELKGGSMPWSGEDKTQELKDFYKLAQERAEQKLSKKRTQSTATSYPSVTVTPRDSRVQ